jgi:flagellar M-ring protein FliF
MIAVLAVVAITAAVVGLVQTARTPAMTTLYSGLESAAAGEVVAAVEGMGVPVEIRGSTILVPVGDRDRVRLALARDGLPKNGPAGYELLDNIDGFGTTSEMFEASYWRAKEGELARTILAAPGVRAARVHIANAAGRPFQRGAEPSASVTVTTNGGQLSTEMAEAIRYMVSSAVAGLSPTAVSVIDAAHGAVLRQGQAADDVSGVRGPGAMREQQLRLEVERLLAARVGEGKAIVTVAVDVDGESERVTERTIDPQSRVVISSDIREITDNSTGGGVGGGATVASNLPQAAGGGEPATSNRTESEERINFEVSQTTRERVRPAGEVRRQTVAVLVDGVVSYGADGNRAWAPRPQEELDQIRDLVRAAVGFNADRGDVVTVEMLEFAERPGTGVVAESGFGRFLENNAMNLIQMGILGAVALGLALFVLRPLMRTSEQQAAAPRLDPEFDGPMLEWPEGSKMHAVAMEGDGDSIAELKNTFVERREESATVLRGWLESETEKGAA